VQTLTAAILGVSFESQISQFGIKNMSPYSPTGSSLNSTNLASAFCEVVRLTNAAEILRNAANPALAPKNNVSVSASFDGNAYAISAELPVQVALDPLTGKPIIDASDYLGAPYSTFVPGTGDAKSTDLPSALLEIAYKLSAAEKAVLPETDQPNNIQIDVSIETGVATITANIPFTPSIVGTDGSVKLTALNYV
jgi:hypothetical protein